MKKYEHIFFDLDHTLWDCDRNCAETLGELYQAHRLQATGIALEVLIEEFDKANHLLWLQFEAGEISKQAVVEGRFPLICENLGLAKGIFPTSIGQEYADLSPQKQYLVPYARELLEHIQAQGYRIHLITNGGSEQFIKLRECQIEDYFERIFTSHLTKARKPDPLIFNEALFQTQALIRESLMVGDSLRTDVRGAETIGMDVVFFNAKGKVHEQSPTYEISCLSELLSIL